MFNGVAPPMLQVQRPSDDLDSLPNISNGGENGSNTGEDSHWHCCKCGTSTQIYVRAGDHPLGALACECPHKPCGSCKTTGLVKTFLPMEEPCMIPVSEVHKDIRFGVLCSCCGLSWRAKEIGRYKKTLRKMPSLGLSMAQIYQKRLSPASIGLRKSKSTLVLGNKRIITPPGHTRGKQAEYATVKFSDVGCTCGSVIDLTSALCFQIVGPQMVEHEKRPVGLSEHKKQIGWSTTPELEELGHGEPIIRIKGVAHPNPLRSCPVTGEDDSMSEKIRGHGGKPHRYGLW
jgi:hypothetical protein